MPRLFPYGLALALLALAGSAAVRAQETVVFDHVTSDDGLPTSYVAALTQDELGFLWIGTPNGLVRYSGRDRYGLGERGDGRGFRVFRDQPDVPGSISGSQIVGLAPGEGGAVWAATADAGLNRYDPTTGLFTVYRTDEADSTSLSSDQMFDKTLLRGRDGTLWVGTYSGLNRLDPGADGFVRYFHDPADSTSLVNDLISALYEDENGTLWVGTLQGLCRLRETRSFSCYALGGLNGDLVSAITSDGEGGLWVGTFASGLWRFDPDTEAFALEPLTGAEADGVLIVTSLAREADGTVWATLKGGYGSGGLFRIGPGGDVDAFVHDLDDPGSLIDDRANVVLVDRQGVVWVGTDDGLDRYDPARGRFRVFRRPPLGNTELSANNVAALLAQNGALWVGTIQGLDRLDLSDGSVRSYDVAGLPGGGTPSAFALGPEGTLWAALSSGIARLSGNQFTGFADGDAVYDPDDEIPDAEQTPFVVQALEAGQVGTLWAGTLGGGLLRFDTATGEHTAYLPDPSDPTTLPSENVSVLQLGRDGRLWVGTDSGLGVLDPESGRVTRYQARPDREGTLAGNNVQALLVEPDGTVWVGTTDGLDRLAPRANVFDHFSAASDHLANDDVRAIRRGADGALWIATASGVTLFDPEGNSRTFGLDRGLPSADFVRTSAEGADGTLYFGTPQGVVAFEPAVMARRNEAAPQVAFTGLRIKNELVVPEEDDALDAPITVADEVRLDYSDDFVTFEFAALHFAYPEGNTFRYRMEGFHDDWRDGGSQGTATYTNLDPGTYTFRVQAVSADGVRSPEGAALRVVVSPPWWRTWWAYALYALLVLAAIWAALRYQRQQAEAREALLRADAAEADARALEAENRRKETELEKTAQLQEAYTQLEASHETLKTTQARLVHAEKMASLGQFTAGVAHEIQNPLNFVNNFSEMSVELVEELREEMEDMKDQPVQAALDELGDLLDDLKLNAEKVNHHGGRATTIVRSMLEHSRLSAGEQRPIDLNGLVKEYLEVSAEGSMAAEHGLTETLTVERDFSDDVGLVAVSPQEIGRVLMNAVDNALYALRERVDASASGDGGFSPTLTVSTERRGDEVAITVRDNGTGMDAETRGKMFEPFFTTKPTGQGSTGLGLSLAYDIVTGGHGGRFEVESAPGEGTTFAIVLPAEPVAAPVPEDEEE